MADKNYCKLCGETHNYVSGNFTKHLKDSHKITLDEYVIIVDYDGVPLICLCGYCDSQPVFNRGKFKKYNSGHNRYKFLREKYIEKYGIPKCRTCKCSVKFNRGIPRKYCSFKCLPNNWNQDKVKETVKSKYGVDNIFQHQDIIKKIQSKLNHEEISIKANETKKLRYDNGAFDHNKMEATMLERYNVKHPSQIIKNRKSASKRMVEYNKNWFKNLKIKKFKNTNIFYQGSFELDFLEKCESIGIIHLVQNGGTYIHEDENGKNRRYTADFKIENIEIEIKSLYILKIQGGIKVLDRKKSAVEDAGMKFFIILEKRYDEFLEYLKIIIDDKT